MTVKNRSNAEHYFWSEVCEGWRLLDGADLSVIEEQMPPGTKEIRHAHTYANQLFYVLEGMLTLEVDDVVQCVKAGDALNVQPGMVHQARNEGANAVRFLVISAPNTKGDRQPA